MFKKYWPAIVVGLLLLAAIPVALWLISQGALPVFTGPSDTPKEVKITNISDNALTVSWITDKTVTGSVTYGTGGPVGASALDDRDGTKAKERNTHHVTLKNLDPATTYSFRLGSGRKFFDNDGKAYKQKTAPTTTDPPTVADPAYGKVTNKEGKAPAEALVYLTIAGGTPLSSYIRADGNYLVTLNNARVADLSTYIKYKAEGDEAQIFVQAVLEGTAKASTDTNNDSPVPAIALGKTFKFGGAGTKPVVEATAPAQTGSGDFSLQPIETVKETVAITSPQSGSSNPSRPQITGTGTPGEVITITIESPQTITAQVTVNPNGTWSYTPKQDLTSGAHTVTVAQGAKTASTNFQVAGASTSKGATVSSLPQAGSGNLLTFSLFVIGLLLFTGGFAGLMKNLR